MFISSQSSTPVFKDLTLVMPAVAVGNVGQLAVDLIISTLNVRRVGYLHTDCLIPMAGNNPYATCKDDAEELHTAAEVYAAPELKLAILQIRAPIVKPKSKRFRQLLLSWIKSSGFSRTVVLSSSHAYQRDDQQLQGLLKASADALKELGWKEMEKVPPCLGHSDANTEPRLVVPGGGITKGLFTDSCTEEVRLAVLLIFCSEGNNIPDAFTLLNHLNDWLHLLDSPKHEANNWKIPASWSLLFGSGIPPALF
ncbi:proteasome assembly chaperone 2 isoform X2 [Dunckerocampus dactyliophorus]|uniref:proteasome assembly chaperone 2 isoform X2 n=1 Tax=Dunckerocampus dactyliophorus TaxID=161453 RepID=UPI0024075035|nr:proteasome assembly chaperone 2 isoform X2 [Dunckerocampus dactyliophorus]